METGKTRHADIQVFFGLRFPISFKSSRSLEQIFHGS